MVTVEKQAESHPGILLITEGLNGIEAGRAGGRIKTGNETDENGEGNGAQDKPPRH